MIIFFLSFVVQLLFVVHKMPKFGEISLENCVTILFLQEQGKSQKEMFTCAVQSAVKRFAENGTHANKPKSVRKRVTTSHLNRKLV